jgi:hypothetical protein
MKAFFKPGRVDTVLSCPPNLANGFGGQMEPAYPSWLSLESICVSAIVQDVLVSEQIATHTTSE